MPTIDPELLAPLFKISDILLKRPGKVSIDSIKRLSNIYGFETFTDTLALENNGKEGDVKNNLVYNLSSHSGSPINAREVGLLVDRLSLSGKILLIDIDFLEGIVNNVSISSAINLQPIDGEVYDFLEGWNGVEPVENILLSNLRCNTLDQFNKNLRILSQFDRLSLNPPNDLFNFFSQLTYNLVTVHKYQEKKLEEHQQDFTNDPSCALNGDEVTRNFNEGYFGLGKILLNQQTKIGLFLKIWEDNRFVNRYLDEKKGVKTREVLTPYFIHFKITENIRNDTGEDKDEDKETGGVSAVTITSAVGVETTPHSITNGVSATGDVSTVDTMDETPETTKSAESSGIKVRWFDNGDWLINANDTALNSNLNSLVLELCPSIWIPQDLLMEFGLQDYEVRTTDNDFFNNNQQDFDDLNLDKFYSRINKNHAIELRLESGKTIRVTYLIGCPMVKIFKITFGRLTKLCDLVNSLRNWCLLNSLMRNLLEHRAKDMEIEAISNAEENGTSIAEAIPSVVAGDTTTTTKTTVSSTTDDTSGEKEDLGEMVEDLRLDDVMKEYASLLDQDRTDDVSSENGSAPDLLSIEDLESDEIALIKGNDTMKIKDGMVYSKDKENVRMAEILTKTEQLVEIL
ncbi:hypothetical protein FOA43_000888 [Brettanomyces nanus]|uniref:Mediator of RNA polymerase II transcription subunit 1 n=1 Tax=Eeniella nana TaxID=13502 RepID=A0A875RX47_EENNA|nr:uncharacterized protein FOA43_000888 [Brettanomyces nanus]QPG73576.1 hypothetical protein FOA43_000888 [Brettanomyces nanus]